MKIIVKIIHFIFEPIRFIGSRDLSNRFVNLFNKHKWLAFVIAFLVSLLAVFLKYIYPTL